MEWEGRGHLPPEEFGEKGPQGDTAGWGAPHHCVALHPGQLEGGEALEVGHELQRLQVVPSVVGQQQVVHLAGEGFVGLQDEDVQHGVSWGGQECQVATA